MVRVSGGNDDHPDSIKFMYLFKLLSTYTLLKPPRGSNVKNEEMFATFSDVMSANSVMNPKEEVVTFSGRDIWSFIKDHGAEIDETDRDIETYNDIVNDLKESEYFKAEHMAGYVVKKSCRFTKCKACIASLMGDREAAGIHLSRKDKFGALHVPSPDLTALLCYLEKKMNAQVGNSDEVGVSNILSDTFFHICRKVDRNIVEKSLHPGCPDHYPSGDLATRIMHFYIIMRVHFILRAAKKLLKTYGKTKKLKKESKMIE